jgi:hypothetical protein
MQAREALGASFCIRLLEKVEKKAAAQSSSD